MGEYAGQYIGSVSIDDLTPDNAVGFYAVCAEYLNDRIKQSPFGIKRFLDEMVDKMGKQSANNAFMLLVGSDDIDSCYEQMGPEPWELNRDIEYWNQWIVDDLVLYLNYNYPPDEVLSELIDPICVVYMSDEDSARDLDDMFGILADKNFEGMLKEAINRS